MQTNAIAEIYKSKIYEKYTKFTNVNQKSIKNIRNFHKTKCISNHNLKKIYNRILRNNYQLKRRIPMNYATMTYSVRMSNTLSVVIHRLTAYLLLVTKEFFAILKTY